MDGWNTFSFPFWAFGLFFRCKLAVSSREGNISCKERQGDFNLKAPKRWSQNLRRSTGKPHLCQAPCEGIFSLEGCSTQDARIITHVGPMYDIFTYIFPLKSTKCM